MSLLFPEGKQDEFDRILTEVRQGRHIEHLETKHLRKDCHAIDVEVTISPSENTG